MAGQLPPEVLEDLMLVEAVNAPAPREGAMPGGFAEFGMNEEGFAEVNVLPPQQGIGAVDDGPLLRDVRGEDSEDEDEEEEESEEEEDISVRIFLSTSFHFF